MQITVLVDNNTLIDRYFLAEPGLSFLIEDENLSILFDTGYSDIFIRNAHKMGKDLAHPESLIDVSAEGLRGIGTLISKDRLAKHFDLKLSRKSQFLTEHLVFLGEIPRTNDFEATLAFGRKDGSSEEDMVIEDSALVYKASKGLVIITGCSRRHLQYH